MATKLDISELDFDEVKTNLKTFLSQQDEFRDYDFEGSGMSVLLDQSLKLIYLIYLPFYLNLSKSVSTTTGSG